MKKLSSFVYVTENGHIPGLAANSVGVMKICHHVAKAGLKVDLLIPDGRQIKSDKSPWDFYDVDKKFDIHYLKGLKFLGKLSLLLFYMQAFFFIIARGVDTVNSRSLIFSCLIGFSRKSVIFESHNYAKFSKSPLKPIWLFLVKSKFFKSSMIVTTQIGYKSYTQDGVPTNKIIVLPNGAEIKNFQSLESKDELRDRLGVPKDKEILCFCGSLYPGRGIDEIIYCVENMPDQFFLIVGGQADDVARYSKIQKDKGLHNMVLSGHVTQDQVPQYLMAADILIMPYTSQTAHPYMSPMKMFDYLATGKPIIATDFSVVREILHEGENAIFVAPDDKQALLEGVQKLVSSPDLQTKLAQGAQESAKLYSWEKRAKALIEHHQKNYNAV